MFEQEYRRELNHNYLILRGTEHTKLDGYELKMLEENKVDGFLPLHICFLDAIPEFHYKIDGMQTMEQKFCGAQIGFRELKEFLFCLYKIVKQAEEYLINVNHLIIKPQYLYLGERGKEIAFVFHPDYEVDAKLSFQEMTEFFLNYVDHRDSKAVLLVYRLYKETRQNNFSLEDLLRFSQQEGGQEEEEGNGKINKADSMQNIMLRDVSVPYLDGEKKPEGYGRRDVLARSDVQRSKNKQKEQEEQIDGAIPKKQGVERSNELQKMQSKTKSRKFWIMEIVLTGLLLAVIGLKRNNILPIGYNTFIILIGGIAMAGIGVAIRECILIRKEDAGAVEEEHRRDILRQKEEAEFRQEKQGEKEAVHLVEFLAEPSGEYGTGGKGQEKIPRQEAREVDWKGKRRISSDYQGKKEIYELSHFPFTVGSLESCVDVEIKDVSIGEIHASFTQEGNVVYLEDLNTWNGTFINGTKLKEEKVAIKEGDEIRFGNISFVYQE